MKILHWINGFIGILLLVSCETQKTKDNPPNVILIISDQWSTRVADGSGDYDNGILTPAIDQLAKEGILFIQGYPTYPLCTQPEPPSLRDYTPTTMEWVSTLDEIPYWIDPKSFQP